MTKIFHIFSLLLLVSFSSTSLTSHLDPFFPDSAKDVFKNLINAMEDLERDIIQSEQQFDEFEKKSNSQINMRNDQELSEVHIKVNDIHASNTPQASYENDVLKISTPQERIWILFENNIITVDIQQQISHDNRMADDTSTKESITTNIFASHTQQHRTFDGKIDLAQSKISYKKDAKELIITIPHKHLSTASIPVTVNVEE